MSGPDDDQDGDAVQQRTVSAADGSPLRNAAASSVFNWRGAGTLPADAPEPPTVQAQQPSTEKEETMPKKKAAARTKFGGPQMAICQALAGGDLGREALGDALTDLTPAQISSALNNSKTQGRIVFIEKDQAYRLTAAGKEWLAATGADADTTTAPKAKRGTAGRRKTAVKRHVRKAAKVAGEVDTSPTEEGEEATFRCGVMSDGAFFLSKGETAIELDAAEHAQMLRYLERMAVEA